MLRRFSLLCLTAALASPTVAGCIRAPDVESEGPNAAAKAPTSPQELLARHVEALGGEETLRALGERTVEARVVFVPQPGCVEEDPSCISKEMVGQFVLYATIQGELFRRMVVGELRPLSHRPLHKFLVDLVVTYSVRFGPTRRWNSPGRWFGTRMVGLAGPAMRWS